MIEVKAEQLEEKETYLLFIYSPFCGTCHVARAFLEQIESTLRKQIFYEMNAMYYPNFMHDNKVENVPCLFIKQDGQIQEKVYTFHSIQNVYHYLLQYAAYLFAENGDELPISDQ